MRSSFPRRATYGDKVHQTDEDDLGPRKYFSKEMSATSRKYDREGKGFLDPSEKKLRDLDTENRGEVDIETAHQIMTKLLVTQNQFLNLKKITMAMFAFILILSLSNLATGFAVFQLTKETNVNSNSELVKKDTGDVIKVRSTGPVLEVTTTTTLVDNVSGLNRSFYVIRQDMVTKALEDVMGGAQSITLHGKEPNESGEHEYSTQMDIDACDIERNENGGIRSFLCRPKGGEEDVGDGSNNTTVNRKLNPMDWMMSSVCACRSTTCNDCNTDSDYYCCVVKNER